MTPPRLATALLKRRLRHQPWLDVTLGDLREEFEVMARRRGRAAASRWYWLETWRLTLPSSSTTAAGPVGHGDSLMRTLLNDCRLALRTMLRQRTVSAAIILTLAVGLGLNAATFGMVDGLLLRPFTIPTVDRLVVVSELSPEEPFPQESVAPGNYWDLRARAGGAISRMTTINWWDANLSGGDQPERLSGSQVGADFFSMLGQQPVQGRFFNSDDEREGAAKTVVISETLWHRRFGQAADIIGRAVQLDGEPYTVIGIAPAEFGFPTGSELWTPATFSADDRANRRSRYLTVVGELTPGTTTAQAQAEMTAAYAPLKDAHADNRRYSLTVLPFGSAMVDYGLPRVLGLWQAAALLLMLIAGTNVINLFLARSADRERELAVRLAIGASRWKLVRQLLVEGVVLSLVALPLALLVAKGAIGVARTVMPPELLRFVPGWTSMNVNGRVILATAVFSIVCAVIFSLLPALKASRPNLTSALKDGGRSQTSGAGRNRVRRALVVAEISFALPLLLCAGLAAMAAHRLASGPQGYEPDGLVRVRMSLSEGAYPDLAARRDFTARLLARTAAAPGVAEYATTSVAPSTSSNQRRQLVLDGRAPEPDGPRWINYRAVSPAFHAVLRIPMLQGRAFTADDRHDREPVAIVSQSLANLYWPDESPLGRRVKLSPTADQWLTIVGVSGNVLDDWFSSRNAPTIYVPVDQFPSTEIHLLARGPGSDGAHIEALRGAVSATDPHLPVFNTETMHAAIRTRTTGLRFISQFMAAFGVISLFLASAGIYSVMAHYVSQRRHEIGVRMALGASARQVLSLTLRQGLRMAAIGIGIGLTLGALLARGMQNMLFGVIGFEPILFILGPVVLGTVAVLATLLPARAAARVNPVSTLRD